ncbi:hypothetical protein Zmor_000657 [Zophobas morio]|uniref:Reverse transcriptase domain-containing protein n=1 Tax=Zophobas morio TaxID=2755281 RepID=A0AA38IXT1_9CUCU|nr:hypothetical protein Zmor_000657 [Zophobas morio]
MDGKEETKRSSKGTERTVSARNVSSTVEESEKIKERTTEISRYTPLCMLDTMGKLYEQVIVARLRKEMEKVIEQVEVARKGAYRHKNLCLLVILDIKNAFNSARWDGIIRHIKRRQITVELTRVV